MIFGAIVAGGTGSRMSSRCEISIDKPLPDIPKQFLPIKDKPLICYSIKQFLCSSIDRLFIGVHADYTEYMTDILRRYFPENANEITLVPGGDDRNGTVMNIIDKASEMFGDDGHYIITHDAVRPFVTADIINKNIELVQKYGAVNTVCPAVDTVVVSDGEFIESVPERSRLYYGQTPQSFDMGKLKRLYLSLDEADRAALTDCTKIFTLCGERVYLAKGDSVNMKITTKNDYFVALALSEYLL